MVYNPKAFIPHAASLGQTFVHCRRFSTAATRRCLGSVSVPVVGAMLSHPLVIKGLVSRYLTNNLVTHKPLPRRNLTFAPQTARSKEIIRYYLQFPAAIPDLGARYLSITTPFAAVHSPEGSLLARLACLIHAANVHSEPGSNPSICLLDRYDQPRVRRHVTRRPDYEHQSKGHHFLFDLSKQCLAQARITPPIQTEFPVLFDCSVEHHQIVKELLQVTTSEQFPWKPSAR